MISTEQLAQTLKISIGQVYSLLAHDLIRPATKVVHGQPIPWDFSAIFKARLLLLVAHSSKLRQPAISKQLDGLITAQLLSEIEEGQPLYIMMRDGQHGIELAHLPNPSAAILGALGSITLIHLPSVAQALRKRIAELTTPA